jgi:hypothetical protein
VGYAVARGAVIQDELIRYRATSDAAHITMPDRAGIEKAIRAAQPMRGSRSTCRFCYPAMVRRLGSTMLPKRKR